MVLQSSRDAGEHRTALLGGNVPEELSNVLFVQLVGILALGVPHHWRAIVAPEHLQASAGARVRAARRGSPHVLGVRNLAAECTLEERFE